MSSSNKSVFQVLKTEDGRGKGLFLVKGTVKKGDIIVRMQKAKTMTFAAFKKKLDSKKERIKLFGRSYPSDIVLHDDKKNLVIYDETIRHARLKNPRTKPTTFDYKGISYTLYDNTLEGRVPKWYRLNHSSKPNVSPYHTYNDDGTVDLYWRAKDTIVVRRRKKVELTFNYNEVPPYFN